MESTSYVLSFRIVFFLTYDHGLDFFTSAYVRIQSINQSINQYKGIQLVHPDSPFVHEYCITFLQFQLQSESQHGVPTVETQWFSLMPFLAFF